MANVNIYSEHRNILDALITSSKVSSLAGATKTGPFKDQRDAYVFAASIAIALDSPTPLESMPKTKKDITMIRDSVFVGANGAEELANTVALIAGNGKTETEESLGNLLESISDLKQDDRFALLDRYAHGGFSWLEKYSKDESSIRDLILTAFNQIECVQNDASELTSVKDPLLDILDVQL